jgi:hypothetical protein
MGSNTKVRTRMQPPSKEVKEAEAFVRKALSHFDEKKPNERAIKKAAREVAEALKPALSLEREEHPA